MNAVICTPTTPSVAANHATDVELAELLARGLSFAWSRPVSVVGLVRKPCDFATLCPVEQVSVELAGGVALSLFVKHLCLDQPEHPDKQRRDREALVYHHLLRTPGLPVPTCYGLASHTDGSCQILILGNVDDWNLKYHALDLWYAAAGRLADLHAHFATRPDLLDRDFLLRLDDTYLHAWARRAVKAVAEGAGDRSGRLAALVNDRYELAAALLAGQPVTLVHNDLAPKNVIATRSSTPAAIYIVDWEMAGAGCGLLDLVHLKYGLSPDADAAMVSTYRTRLRGTHLLPADDAAFGTLLAACELHKTLYRLAHSAGWRLPSERVAQWILEAEDLMRRVEEGGR